MSHHRPFRRRDAHEHVAFSLTRALRLVFNRNRVEQAFMPAVNLQSSSGLQPLRYTSSLLLYPSAFLSRVERATAQSKDSENAAHWLPASVSPAKRVFPGTSLR